MFLSQLRRIMVMLLLGLLLSASTVKGATVAYWRAEDGPGTTLRDSSGSGNDGRLLNGILFSPDVPFAKVPLTGESNNFSISLDGANDIAIITDSSFLRPDISLTIEAFIKPELGARVVLGKQLHQGCCVNSFQLELSPFRFQLTDVTGVAHLIGPGVEPSPGVWHHIAGTWDGTTMRLYLDGIQLASGPFSGVIGYDANPVLIGGEDDGRGIPGCCLFQGKIDEVRISDTALKPLDFLLASRCQEDLAACQLSLANCQSSVSSLNTDLANCQRRLTDTLSTVEALQGQITILQNQIMALQSENGQLQMTLASVDGLLKRMEADFRIVFKAPVFVIPGNNSIERLRNLIDAIISLNKGRKEGIYENLGGKN